MKAHRTALIAAILAVAALTMNYFIDAVADPEIHIGTECGVTYVLGMYRYDSPISRDHPVFIDSSYFFMTLRRGSFDYDRGPQWSNMISTGGDSGELVLGEILEACTLKTYLRPRNQWVVSGGDSVWFCFLHAWHSDTCGGLPIWHEDFFQNRRGDNLRKI